ncbi:unnamed protein product [Tilletia controversa]|uniref:Cyclin-like domain-containing protein n=1 Tax=Tilletia controversa TaxID=13291 RepID=A0A8X7SWA3_9BASI|nr:hypothetical protein A4X06_0g4654 [Tilletia controversa]CAD6908701.1 unnamed protein product [Tilletia controversa]CAD6950468.1 unnamed protein product [Tilletia controversa]CAD6971912.1 unnamed protein product [Tilletia controversa]CAD6971952.1 unnamed protein product [Tilletia controversa]
MAPLPNTLAGLHQLSETPSRADGIPNDLEEELRVYGCQLIQQAGILLHLPQVAMATAQVLFQRFWFVSSMKQFCIKDISMGALFLACKLEEQYVRVRDVINVFDFLIQRALHLSKCNPGPRSLELSGIVQVGDVSSMRARLRSSVISRPGHLYAGNGHGSSMTHSSALPAGPAGTQASSFEYKPPSYFSQDFYDVKDALVIAEMQILKRLGFNVQVNLPFATMVNYLKLLGLTDDRQAGNGASSPTTNSSRQSSFAQRAWSYLNDALQTSLYCQFPPHILACAAIYLTALTNRPEPLALPMQPRPWWVLFDVEEEDDLRIISTALLRLYDDSGWEIVEKNGGGNNDDDTGAEVTLGSMGLASRVRDEWGGLVDLVDRRALRHWLEQQASSDVIMAT